MVFQELVKGIKPAAASDDEEEATNHHSKELLKTAAKTAQTPAAAVRELPRLFFTKEELSSCSVRGIRTHSENIRMPLPSKRLDLLHGLVQKFHSSTTTAINCVLSDLIKHTS
jgi:hypothetical protein